jgi:cell division protein FtsW (lipid II flippase)
MTKRFVILGLIGIIAVLASDIWWLDEHDFQRAANVSLIYLAVLTAVFTARYAGWSQWYVNRIGRSYLTFKVVMSLVLAQIVVATWWDPDFPGRQHLRFLIYSLGAIAAIPMLTALIREQRADEEIRRSLRRKRDENRAEYDDGDDRYSPYRSRSESDESDSSE